MSRKKPEFVECKQHRPAFASTYSLISVFVVNVIVKLAMVDVLKFRTLILLISCLPKRSRETGQTQIRSSQIGVCLVCYSDNRFVNSSHDNQHFISEQKEKKAF